MFDKQKTIAKKITLQGVGLYTEKNVTITFKPAPENSGFLFVRTDIEEKPSIKAHLSFLFNETTDRGIILEKNGLKICTIEHVLATLMGMDLDNVIIELDNMEFPIMDGSSKYFVEAIEKAGVIEQNAERGYYSIKEIISHVDSKTGGEIIALPSKKLEIVTMVDFDSKFINIQNAVLKYPDQFKQIASSRTFCFIYEKENLMKIQNGNIFRTPSYYNEIAKHNLLDIMGYLTLIGVKLKGKIIAYNTDHHINTLFARKLIQNKNIQIHKDIPKFDLTKKPILDIRNIMRILPHKPPFLLVDKIMELTDDYVIGVKNVTMNESFFIGHFPKEPIMPGVLQIEAIAQVGGVLVLNKVKNPEYYSTYFLKIDKVKFKKKVIPGDLLVFQVDLLEPIRRGIVHMQGKGYVNNQLVVEAEVMAKIVKIQESS
ncbi:3-hydroxyacyl-ACP dehydratase FabZ [Blattabacterium cuenoti]|uniref:3-hydroxyacyl-ACP dehydratase FabZ n=1 Tax=Blattabacterium cuenoti TaxID=1653831 RepID=UPI00163D2A28|nr:3-hydroxyacyl-ACP dehydratase FabZ [Blattabacterium cuenoti]